MACPITEEISRYGSFQTCISWTFFNPKTHWPWLETSKMLNLVKFKVQEILCESHGLLPPPLMDDFVAKHIFTWLPMDLSMLWHLHRINKTWFKVVGKTSAWQTLKIVKFNNSSYCHTIVIQGLPRLSLKAQLNFKLKCLQYCIMANDSWNSLDDIETWHLYLTFHYVNF
jgi:hypothetical protein